MAFKLAELFIQFSAKGLTEVKSSLSGLKELTTQYGDVMNAVGGKLKEQYDAAHKVLADTLQTKLAPAAALVNERLIKTLAAVAGVTQEEIKQRIATELTNRELEKKRAKLKELDDQRAAAAARSGVGAMGIIDVAAVGLAALGIERFARAGFGASAMGQVFNSQMEILSRTIAGLFGPELQKVLDLTQRLTGWIQNMSAEQKQSIAHWIEGAFAATSMALILPRVASGITALVTGVKALSAAFLGLGVSTGGILPLLGALITGLTFVMTSTNAGRSSLGGIAENLKPLGEALVNTLTTLAPLFESLAEVLNTLLLPALKGLADTVRWVSDQLAQAGANQRDVRQQSALAAGLRLLWIGTAVTDTINRIRDSLGMQQINQRGAADNRNQLPPPVRFDSDPTAAYFRAATASINASMASSHETIVENHLETIARNTDATNRSVREIRPPIAP